MYYLDFRKEVSRILQDFGRKVLILHNDRRIRCPLCWSAVYNEPRTDCPQCLGTGYSWTVKIHRTYSSYTTSPADLPTPEMSPYQSDIVYFFFQHDVIIDSGDYILDLEQHHVMAVYKVIRRPILYGLGGRREFIRVSARQRPEELARMREWWEAGTPRV